MKKNNFKNISVLAVLLVALFASLTLVSQSQLFQKRAEESSAEVNFDGKPQAELKRSWQNFSQGGEERIPMLAPAQNQIRTLTPNYIRIDHLFDFYEIIKKDASDQISYDFSNLDQRIGEILNIGALPFLSLSYYPSAISSNPVEGVISYESWQNLVAKVIQRYSGEKQIGNIYYEVWNEPDLFGKMNPETYFQLYKASVLASQSCTNCSPFKIGGPAITTLKQDWLNNFLTSVKKENLRLDFISWHSYQISTEKTLNEAQLVANYKNTFPNAELIISEWGSVPEMSAYHDSYFDAAHAVSGISQLNDFVDKIFTFELVDGPDPKGKKYWGRWGLLTDDSVGITAKPRFYSFIYLNKLLDFEVRKSGSSSNINSLGSADGKESYSFVVSRQNGSNIIPVALSLTNALPGTYLINNYFLDQNHNPLVVQSATKNTNGSKLLLTNQMVPNSVQLIEAIRTSPAVILSAGRTNLANDSSAKAALGTPPLVFIWNKIEKVTSGKISFWFKTNWNDVEIASHTFFDSKDENGNGLSGWFENIDKPEIHFGLFKNNVLSAQVKLAIGNWDRNDWHNIILFFNKTQKAIGLKIDAQQSTAALEDSVSVGDFLYIGSNAGETNSAEGFVDNLVIEANGNVLYDKNFD